jgi:Flp pilus assembly protein TadD
MRRIRAWLITAGLIYLAGCASSPQDRLLQLPAASEQNAKQSNAEGIREFQSGSWTQAQRHFELAMKADPQVAETHYNLGLVLYRLGKGVAAEKHFTEAKKLAPNDPVISNYRKLYKAPEQKITPPQERSRRP